MLREISRITSVDTHLRMDCDNATLMPKVDFPVPVQPPMRIN